VAAIDASYTGRYLKPVLGLHPIAETGERNKRLRAVPPRKVSGELLR
jgi:hypothetical protein